MLRVQWTCLNLSCDLHEAAVLILALLVKDFSPSECSSDFSPCYMHIFTVPVTYSNYSQMSTKSTIVDFLGNFPGKLYF